MVPLIGKSETCRASEVKDLALLEPFASLPTSNL
jgi:hypothetical protein